jgi:hypothetical protein
VKLQTQVRPNTDDFLCASTSKAWNNPPPPILNGGAHSNRVTYHIHRLEVNSSRDIWDPSINYDAESLAFFREIQETLSWKETSGQLFSTRYIKLPQQPIMHIGPASRNYPGPTSCGHGIQSQKNATH